MPLYRQNQYLKVEYANPLLHLTRQKLGAHFIKIFCGALIILRMTKILPISIEAITNHLFPFFNQLLNQVRKIVVLPAVLAYIPSGFKNINSHADGVIIGW